MMNNSPMVLRAIAFAHRKHAHQKRRASGLPYIVHPHGASVVLQIFKRSKRIEELICAIYLHDVLEDTDTDVEEIRKEFGELVASLCLELKNDKQVIREEFDGSKLRYLKSKLMGMTSYALTLKLCDRLDNVLSQPTPKVLKETRELLQYIFSNRKLTRPQYALVEIILSMVDRMDPILINDVVEGKVDPRKHGMEPL